MGKFLPKVKKKVVAMTASTPDSGVSSAVQAHSCKIQAYRRGLWAEWCAAIFLYRQGFSIIKRRFRTPVGELDCVARQKNQLVFVEVKARSTVQRGLESITSRQQERILQAADFFLMCFPRYQGWDMRFDVVIKTPQGDPQHFPHLFFQEG